jgi:hypothetical protein
VLALLLVLGALGWGVERLVVTDREAIESLLETSAAAVSRDDWAAFEATIDDAYAARGRDKRAFVAFVRGLKERHKPAGVGIEIGDTAVAGDQAAAHVVVKPGAPYVGLRVGGRVDVVRSPGGWRIVAVSEDEPGFLGR